MLSIGPVPMTLVVIALALAFAAGTSYMLTRRTTGDAPLPLMSHIWDMLLVGALIARLAFIVKWWPQYAADPWAMVRIHDGGFMAAPGILAGLAFGFWRTRNAVQVRKPLAMTALAGVAAWVALSVGLAQFQRQTLSIPQTELFTLEGSRTRLSDHVGTPMVVNLWASWCPPCRREMPVLAAAQAQRDDVLFAFINQGESAAVITEYLQRDRLALENVLLDLQGEVGQALQSQGLPATLFFNAEGRLVETHFGPLSGASLAAKMTGLSPGALK
ncbi:TlpA disulfide reductase family protein [Polycyclovorans algicola]|uniref:TlpA disulfide reductase family protein n=1 Tax=Polycyclovorans algicola TaxID=616992 RepID=UPI0005B9967E|nr:TlpA disulfide reductase family protein [Polycyclovorans algicola]